MSTTRVIASVAVSAVLAVAGCSDSGQSAAVNAPAGASAMDVVIGTDGDPSAPTSVQYTCPGSGTGPVCGLEIVHGHWAKTLNVPVGTEIWIHATNAKDPGSNGSPPNCWITDAAGHEIYSKSDGGSCVLQVKAAPPA
jgi:hypothetical protein